MMNSITTATAMIATTSQHHSTIDATVIGTITAVTSLSTWLLAEVNPWGFDDELKLTLLPLIGALLVTGAAMQLNPERETRRIVIGRSMLSLLFGCLAPQVLSILFPSAAALILRSPITLCVGAVATGIVYILSYPLFAGGYKRARGVADNLLDKAQEATRTNTRQAIDEQFAGSSDIRKANVMEAVKEQIHEEVKEANRNTEKE